MCFRPAYDRTVSMLSDQAGPVSMGPLGVLNDNGKVRRVSFLVNNPFFSKTIRNKSKKPFQLSHITKVRTLTPEMKEQIAVLSSDV